MQAINPPTLLSLCSSKRFRAQACWQCSIPDVSLKPLQRPLVYSMYPYRPEKET